MHFAFIPTGPEGADGECWRELCLGTMAVAPDNRAQD